MKTGAMRRIVSRETRSVQVPGTGIEGSTVECDALAAGPFRKVGREFEENYSTRTLTLNQYRAAGFKEHESPESIMRRKVDCCSPAQCNRRAGLTGSRSSSVRNPRYHQNSSQRAGANVTSETRRRLSRSPAAGSHDIFGAASKEGTLTTPQSVCGISIKSRRQTGLYSGEPQKPWQEPKLQAYVDYIECRDVADGTPLETRWCPQPMGRVECVTRKGEAKEEALYRGLHLEAPPEIHPYHAEGEIRHRTKLRSARRGWEEEVRCGLKPFPDELKGLESSPAAFTMINSGVKASGVEFSEHKK